MTRAVDIAAELEEFGGRQHAPAARGEFTRPLFEDHLPIALTHSEAALHLAWYIDQVDRYLTEAEETLAPGPLWAARRNLQLQRAAGDLALSHVISDLQTGSSLASWDEARHLVDLVLARALGHDTLTLEWEPV